MTVLHSFDNGVFTLTLNRPEARNALNGQMCEDLRKSAERIAGLAGLKKSASFLMVEETGTGPAHPFSGEKLAPVLAALTAAWML